MTPRTAAPARTRGDAAVPPFWMWFAKNFRDHYAVRFVRKHFHAVRLSRSGVPVPTSDAPILIVLNHPSWWDPMVCTALSLAFTLREHYAAIDDAMLKRYGFFKWLGFFGVDPHSVRGAATFLRTGEAILSKPNRVLWVTAQGRFTDVRVRPLGLEAGVGHLAARLTRGVILPVALEYTFWTEKTPEALVRVGPALDVADSPGLSGRDWTQRIEAALTETLDRLNAEAMTRDPGLFVPLVGGTAGVGGAYGLWQRVKATATGRRYEAAHGGDQP